MKRISETLMAMPPTGHPLVEAARDALKLPARNHAPVEGDHWRPACDRFVLPGDWFEALDQVFDSLDARLAAISVARAPLLPCFIECGKLGFFLYGDATSPNVTAFERSDRSRVVPIVTFVLSEANKARFGDEGAFEIRCEASSPTEGMLAHARALTLVAVATLAALSSPRVTSVRRVLPSMLDRARAARSRRRAQVGLPLSSYNKVEFVLPKTALHRGKVRPVESFAGLRGHMVVGHWRLIDGVLEPYWLWVDGHCRGNADLGWVSKERRVVRHDDLRRGFRMPEHDGHPGERLPAVRGGRRHER